MTAGQTQVHWFAYGNGSLVSSREQRKLRKPLLAPRNQAVPVRMEDRRTGVADPQPRDNFTGWDIPKQYAVAAGHRHPAKIDVEVILQQQPPAFVSQSICSKDEPCSAVPG